MVISTLNQSNTALQSETPNPRGTRCPVCGGQSANKYLEAPDRFHGRTEVYQLVRCASCSLVWLKDPPPRTEMADHYGTDYDRAIAGGGEDPEHWRGK